VSLVVLISIPNCGGRCGVTATPETRIPARAAIPFMNPSSPKKMLSVARPLLVLRGPDLRVGDSTAFAVRASRSWMTLH
jgi:hypothetical protein